MPNAVYAIIHDCSICALNPMHRKWERGLQLFFPEDPVEYITMDILGHLVRTEQEQ